ncbi:MAG: hypothetical protein ACYSTT_14825, partial [Planctomycetota bacterium]
LCSRELERMCGSTAFCMQAVVLLCRAIKPPFLSWERRFFYCHALAKRARDRRRMQKQFSGWEVQK